MTAHKVVWLIGLVFVHLGAVIGLTGGYLNANTPAADGANIGAGIMEGLGGLLFLSGVALEIAAWAVRASDHRGQRRTRTLIEPPFPPVG